MEIEKIKKGYSLTESKMSLSDWLKEKNNAEIDILNVELSRDISEMYEIDRNGNVSLLEVHSELQEKMDLLEQKCREAGINIKITEAVRSVSRQDELYAKGRTTSGDIVTNAKGSDYSSMHQWGIAFDVCINEVNDAYNEEKLKKVGQLGKSIGLEWGGDFKSFTDMPHFQLPGYSIEELKEEYGDPSGFLSTWN